MKVSHPENCAVELHQVDKTYQHNSHEIKAVRQINLQVCPGELLLVVGPSGSGKTTLLSLISGLLKPTEGEVILFQQNISSYNGQELQRMRAQQIGFIFQNFLLIEAFTAIENLIIVQRFAGKSKAEARRKGFELLGQFGIRELAEKFPHQLSQGQKQRVAVARAIANDALLILADEPTASLDTTQGYEIIRLLHDLAKIQHKCVIVVSHDLRLISFADRVVRLADGMITAVEKTQPH